MQIEYAGPIAKQLHYAAKARRLRMVLQQQSNITHVVQPEPEQKPKYEPKWYFIQEREPTTFESVKRIIITTARFYGLTPAELTGKRRQKKLVHARHMAQAIIKTTLKISYPAIGRRFGGLDHTSVLFAVNKINRRLFEPDIAAEFKAILDILEGN